MAENKSAPQSVALLLTGNYRTFDKTYFLIKKNILDPCQHSNNIVKIFLYCESDKSGPELERIISQRLGPEYIGRIFVITSSKTKEYNGIFNLLQAGKPALTREIFEKASQQDRHTWNSSYLYNSGSILQYYQFMKCFDLMLEYEREHNCTFDICIRSRLDIIIGQPLDLPSFFSTINKTILDRVDHDKELYTRSLGLSHIVDSLKSEIVKLEPTAQKYTLKPYLPSTEKVDENKLLESINNDNFLWTFGIEQIWIGKRHVFNSLRNMIYDYGNYINPNHVCTFNSESFFIYHMQHLNIKQFIFNTTEDLLFNYNYFKNINIVQTIPGIFAIVR